MCRKEKDDHGLEKMFTTEFVADLFSVTKETVRNWIAAGDLEALPVHGYWRVPRRAIVKLQAQRPPAPARPVTPSGPRRASAGKRRDIRGMVRELKRGLAVGEVRTFAWFAAACSKSAGANVYGSVYGCLKEERNLTWLGVEQTEAVVPGRLKPMPAIRVVRAG